MSKQVEKRDFPVSEVRRYLEPGPIVLVSSSVNETSTSFRPKKKADTRLDIGLPERSMIDCPSARVSYRPYRPRPLP